MKRRKSESLESRKPAVSPPLRTYNEIRAYLNRASSEPCTLEEHREYLRKMVEAFGQSMQVEVYDSGATLDKEQKAARKNLRQFFRALEEWHMKALELTHGGKIDLATVRLGPVKN